MAEKKRKFNRSNSLFTRAKEVIPLASQTFSKSFFQYVKGRAPLFIERGRGAYVWDIDGNRYLDMVNALLPVILGYHYPAVDQAIRNQLKRGISFSLASSLEYELARLLIKHIPCAEMVRFGKNGSDVTTAAVRLARAVTGRDHITLCGYHGWHDWSIGVTARNLGVPEAVQRLSHQFVYNDIESLEKIFLKYPKGIAAVVMEPMNYEEPRNNFLVKVKNLAHRYGALLVFDEIITGFRFSLGGAQKLFGVIPDLAAFGKSMANGMPISVLTGRRKYMEKIADIFFSSTFGGETLSLAAAIVTIKELEKGALKKIWQVGEYLKKETEALIQENNLERTLQIKGKPCWQVFSIVGDGGYSDLEIKTYLQQELIQAGFLWYGQHNISFSHTKNNLRRLLETYQKVFRRLKIHLERGDLKQRLRGGLITDIFRVR